MAAGGLYAYRVSRELGATDPPFSALIWAAMRKADSVNSEKLRYMWPELWDELQIRYWAPGGLVPGEHVDGDDDTDEVLVEDDNNGIEES